MSGISKETVLQVIRDFWIPFVLACGWTAYSVLGQEITVKTVFSTLGPSFFMFSWLSGQLIRVRKQAGVEKSFNQLQSRMGEMIEEFQGKALATIDHITGGDSYCYAEPQLSRPTYYPIQWMVRNAGDYPMYQVAVRIDDLSSREIFLPGAIHMDSKDVVLGDIPCKVARHFDWSHVGQTESRHFTLTFEARNGILIQDLIIRRINGELGFAYRLKKNDEKLTVIKEIVPANFPRDENGEFDWSEPPVSDYDGLSFRSNRGQHL